MILDRLIFVLTPSLDEGVEFDRILRLSISKVRWHNLEEM